MDLKKIEKPEDLNQEGLALFVLDMFHRLIVHYTLWFSAVEHQFGMEKALEIMREANMNSYKIQMDRFAKFFGFKMKNGIPEVLLNMPKESLLELTTAIGVNWLADDGVWFQAVEAQRDMYDAKRCNDSCWTRFSPVEAWSIKKFLGMPLHAGLDGLMIALRFRMYARINVQTIIRENPSTVIFQMNDCRVQSARKKRGLEDYPCKSAGLVEYRHFAESIDDRIKTECIGCPPDKHPDEWFCAWKFTLEE
jgi:hypothetical protein